MYIILLWAFSKHWFSVRRCPLCRGPRSCVVRSALHFARFATNEMSNFDTSTNYVRRFGGRIHAPKINPNKKPPLARSANSADADEQVWNFFSVMY